MKWSAFLVTDSFIAMFDFSYAPVFLSWLIFLPAVVALIIALLPLSGETIKRISLATTAVVFVMTLSMMFGWGDVKFETGNQYAGMQHLFAHQWIPSFGIYYQMGVDGISFPLIALTAFISMLAMAASWPIAKHVKAYCVLFLLLETGMLGVFGALDFFLFYVFWEVMLLPMYRGRSTRRSNSSCTRWSAAC
jgi:NADH-quinone oxidoreductase subunit M